MPRSNKLCDCGRPASNHVDGNTHICESCWQKDNRWNKQPRRPTQVPSRVDYVYASPIPGHNMSGMLRRHGMY